MKKMLLIFIYSLLAVSLFAAVEKNITVLEFTTDSGTNQMKTLVSDYIAVLVSEDDNYLLLNAIDRDGILKDKSINTSSASNLQIARSLPVELFVEGRLSSENGYSLQMSLVNAGTGKKIKSSAGEYSDLDSLLKDCENLTDALFSKEVADASSGSSSSSNSVSGSSSSSTYKSRIYGSDYKYTYNGEEYPWANFPELADEIVKAMPESSKAAAYREDLNNASTTDNVLTIGGAGLALGGMGIVLAVNLEEGEMTELSWVGVGIAGLGLILEFIGVLSESDVPIMAEMVDFYNRNI